MIKSPHPSGQQERQPSPEILVAPHDRRTEWFVPAFGPLKFRLLLGLLFLPYTGMVLAYTVIGAMLAPSIHWDRVGALLIIYFLALGIGAHALDALGSGGVKPWGAIFAPRQLKLLAGVSIGVAYVIGSYYMLRDVPLLWPVALLEGFFVLAYNLEWFNGRFHTDTWFALSWGCLPVLAGYVMQTNSLSFAALLIAGSMGLFSFIEIKASRPYKDLKRRTSAGETTDPEQLQRLETILKCVSFGVMLLGAGLISGRWIQ